MRLLKETDDLSSEDYLKGYLKDFEDQTEKNLHRRNYAWLLVYSALFTSLLAFFILIIGMIELESSTPERNYQKLVHQLHMQVLSEKEQQGLDWLEVENTLSKGVRLTISEDVFRQVSLFQSASDQVNALHVPYLIKISELIKAIRVDEFTERNQRLVQQIEAHGFELFMTIRVEGHTDSLRLARGARFVNNVELSTFRAYAVKDLIQSHTKLPSYFFSISGYGSFRPLMLDSTSAKNRRVEIYLQPQVISQRANDV